MKNLFGGSILPLPLVLLFGEVSSKTTLAVTLALPSSLVLTTITELFGPSPSEEKANTLNSYFVNLSKPVTFLARTVALFMSSMVVGESAAYFFL